MFFPCLADENGARQDAVPKFDLVPDFYYARLRRRIRPNPARALPNNVREAGSADNDALVAAKIENATDLCRIELLLG